MQRINICMMFILVNLFIQGETGGKCNRLESILYGDKLINVTLYYCCRHYELKAGQCAACARGFTSNGSQCEPCPNEKYGQRCGEKCSCKKEQRCDHIEGCVLHREDKTHDIKEKTVKSTEKDIKEKTVKSTEKGPDAVVIYMCSIAGIGLVCVMVFK